MLCAQFDVADLAHDDLCSGGQRLTCAINHPVVVDTVVGRDFASDQPAAMHRDSLCSWNSVLHQGIEQAELAEHRDLRANKLLGAKVRRMDWVRVDQGNSMPLPSQEDGA